MANEKTEELERVADSIKEHEDALASLYRKHAELTGDAGRYTCHIRLGAHRIRLQPGSMKEAAGLFAEITRVNVAALRDLASGFQWTTDPEAQALEGCPPRDVWNDLRSVAQGAAKDSGKPGEPIAQDCDCTTSPAAAVESYLSSFGAANADLRHAFDTLRALHASTIPDKCPFKTFVGALRHYMRITGSLQEWVRTESAVAARNERDLPPDFAQIWRPYSPEPALPAGYVADVNGWKVDEDSMTGSVRDWPFRWRVVRKEAQCRMVTPSEAARVVAGHVPNELFLFDEYRAMARRLRAELDTERSLTEKLRAELDAERAKRSSDAKPEDKK